MHVHRLPAGLASAALTLIAMGGAPAQDVVDDALVTKAKASEELVDGWSRGLELGFTGSFNHSDHVVGAPDGSTVQFGVVLSGNADLVQGAQEWENELKLQHTQSKSPALDRFVKSVDQLDLQTTYLYHMTSPDWFGPFARASLSTSVLKGYEVRTSDTDVRRVDEDGTVTDVVVPAENDIDLTGAFEPMLLKETVGVFADPIREDNIALGSKAGLGLQQVVVSDGYALASEDGGLMTLSQLQGASEIGAEMELDLNGKSGESVSYEATLNLFYPISSSSDHEFDGLKALNTDLSGKVSFKLSGWASFDYVLGIKRLPVLLDEWQITNGFILTAGFSLL